MLTQPYLLPIYLCLRRHFSRVFSRAPRQTLRSEPRAQCIYYVVAFLGSFAPRIFSREGISTRLLFSFRARAYNGNGAATFAFAYMRARAFIVTIRERAREIDDKDPQWAGINLLRKA